MNKPEPVADESKNGEASPKTKRIQALLKKSPPRITYSTEIT